MYLIQPLQLMPPLPSMSIIIMNILQATAVPQTLLSMIIQILQQMHLVQLQQLHHRQLQLSKLIPQP